jgi:uncharacterized protein (TIGR03435 family)
MVRSVGVAVFALLSAWALFAQSAAPRPAFEEFEVATIKPAGPEAGRWIRMLSTNRLFAKNHTLRSLIQAAYNLTPRAISGGPSWIDSESYDILAETPGDVRPSLDEQMSMLQKLLADRFKLTFHREPKEFSIYALTVAKNGPRLKESAAPGELPKLTNVVFPDHISLPARSATMAQFASMLQRAVLDRPVVDETGLSGKYDFDLEWADDESQFGGQLRKRASADDGHDKSGLFAAMQEQVGLRLEATKGPIETLVIDQVAKPSEN